MCSLSSLEVSCCVVELDITQLLAVVDMICTSSTAGFDGSILVTSLLCDRNMKNLTKDRSEPKKHLPIIQNQKHKRSEGSI